MASVEEVTGKILYRLSLDPRARELAARVLERCRRLNPHTVPPTHPFTHHSGLRSPGRHPQRRNRGEPSRFPARRFHLLHPQKFLPEGA
jgi:hypothetical protein